MNARAVLALAVVCLAGPAAAQVPIPLVKMKSPIGHCTTQNVTGDFNDRLLGGSKFKLPGTATSSPLCDFYAHAGWDTPMTLHLGEGADEHEELIERAVEVWNEAVQIPFLGDVIRISNARPDNYRVPARFGENDEWGEDNAFDGESVIYFPEYESEGSWGFTWVRTGKHHITYRDSMIEADAYVNVTDEQRGHTLILAKKLFSVDSAYSAYALYNKTYAVILHEIGHAIGLKHIPVSGNVMSKDFGAGGIDQWSATLAMDLYDVLSPRNNKFVERDRDISPYMRVDSNLKSVMKRVEFFTDHAKLGEQEKMALTCIYEY